MKEIRKNKWSLSLNQFMVAMLCFLAFGLTGCKSSSLATLKSSVETGKKLLPMDLGNGITMTDMYISNGSLYYIYKVDEDQVPLASWNDEVIANVKAVTINELKTRVQGDASNAKLIHLCSQTGTDIIFRYKGNQTGIEYDITVGSNEL